MHKIILLLFGLSSAFLGSAQTAQEVIQTYIEKTGGKEKWEKVETYTLQRSFVANAPTDYDMEVVADPKGKQISRMKSIMKRDFFYVVKGNDGWLKIPMGSMDKNVRYTVKDLSTSERVAMQQELKDGLHPFNYWEEKGFKMTFQAYRTVGNKTLATITLTRDKDKWEYTFNKATGLVEKEVITTPSLTETWEHLKYGETEDGLMYPVLSEYFDSKVKRKTKVTSSLMVNMAIEPALFLRE